MTRELTDEESLQLHRAVLATNPTPWMAYAIRRVLEVRGLAAALWLCEEWRWR